MKNICEFISRFFALWVVIAACAAFFAPQAFTWFQPAIVPTLGIIMFGMGVTLTPADFARVWIEPKAVGVGVLIQFLVMPALGGALAYFFKLPPPVAVGVVLVGACPGGTASNVIAYLAKVDVALSVTITAMTTILGVIATPYLTKIYAGHYLAVDAVAMLFTVAKIVLLPVTAGLLLRRVLKEKSEGILAVMPVISVAGIVMIVSCVVGLSHASLVSMAPILFLVVFCHHFLGAVFGYGMARLMRLSEIQARTIAIEISTQDSGLGVALARKHFSDVLVALPSALYSIWQNIAGPLLATYWAGHAPKKSEMSVAIKTGEEAF